MCKYSMFERMMLNENDAFPAALIRMFDWLIDELMFLSGSRCVLCCDCVKTWRFSQVKWRQPANSECLNLIIRFDHNSNKPSAEWPQHLCTSMNSVGVCVDLHMNCVMQWFAWKCTLKQQVSPSACIYLPAI